MRCAVHGGVATRGVVLASRYKRPCCSCSHVLLRPASWSRRHAVRACERRASRHFEHRFTRSCARGFCTSLLRDWPESLRACRRPQSAGDGACDAMPAACGGERPRAAVGDVGAQHFPFACLLCLAPRSDPCRRVPLLGVLATAVNAGAPRLGCRAVAPVAACAPQAAPTRQRPPHMWPRSASKKAWAGATCCPTWPPSCVRRLPASVPISLR